MTESYIEEFVEDCRRVAEHRLVECSSGNFSRRLNDTHMLITATRSWMKEMETDQVAVCTISDGKSCNGVKPSVEVGFHAGILRVRPEVLFVLHCQMPAATALACARDVEEVDFNLTAEMPFYVGPVGFVPYRQPGTAELAQAVVDVMKSCNLAVLRNHGQVLAGKSAREVIQNAVFFEMTCGMVLRLGDRVKPMDPACAERLYAAGKKEHGGAV